MTQRRSVNHLHGAQAPKKPARNRSSALGRWARAAAVLCAGVLLAASAAEVKGFHEPEFREPTAPVWIIRLIMVEEAQQEVYAPPIAVDYVYDVIFSPRSNVPTPAKGKAPKWPLRMKFKGDKNINQVVNRWDGPFGVYADKNLIEQSREWIKALYFVFAGIAHVPVDASHSREGAAVRILLTEDDYSLEQMWSDAEAQYDNALKGLGPHESAAQREYVEDLDGVTALFMPGEPTKAGCFYIGAIDGGNTIRSGVIGIDKDLRWDKQRHCIIQGMLRLSGFLGEVGAFPSPLRDDVNAVGLGMYDRLALRELYRPEIQNGMPLDDAMAITKKYLEAGQ